jgi:8-oxo-dGTP pyrophosphatase MutT (NUDIX family)
MPTFGPTVVVVQDGKVLLQLREDATVWNHPGGAIEPGESLAQAAVREVREETGLEVRLTRLVGIYSRPKWRRGGGHDVTFAARPVGGDLTLALPDETLDVRFFDPAHLPDRLLWWHRRMIADALSDAREGRVWSQNVVWPFPQEVDRRAALEEARRDPAAGARWLDALCVLPKPEDECLEVGQP